MFGKPVVWECPTEASVPPVISFSPNWATIFYGESVTLTCNLDLNPEGEKRYSWYRDNEQINQYEQHFRIKFASWADRGNYQCQAGASEKSDAVRLDVSHELFTIPHIKVNPGDILEGDHMTITCDTKLSPRRATTELQFVFYRNGHNVQGFSSSNQYGVPSAQLEHSGNYTCEVQTPTGSVRKRSSVSYLWILGEIS
ncbi:hypothetical protein XELAEV_18042833mg [Xenopus laevis]|uniref:Ig-like domain-containing protein n=1 Tax=Xenopus laevis TaxID=8355 RepID=A0A974C4Y6_XENLA|nr:hypothetical protein XELAEV_18042833mg [Xenopus laevis]